MSLQTIGWGDTLCSTCRSRRPAGATLSSMHVALNTYPRRHIRAGMSPVTSSSSDMQGLACRTSHGSGATCSPWHVAPHTREARHGSGCSVARPLEQGDIHPLARRHSPYCMSCRARGWSDMPRPHRRRARVRLSLGTVSSGSQLAASIRSASATTAEARERKIRATAVVWSHNERGGRNRLSRRGCRARGDASASADRIELITLCLPLT
jgi:hypothetical protein